MISIKKTEGRISDKKNFNPLENLRIWQRFHIKISFLYGCTVFFALILLGGFFYKILFNAELENLQKRLLAMTTSLATSINADAITSIPLDSTEMTPFHDMLLKRFKEVAIRDPDVETIYILRPSKEPTKLRFLIDYAKDGITGKPGDLYDASDVPVMFKGFQSPAVEDKLYADEFGLTLSGYAPIVTKDGHSVALVGIDVKADRIKLIKQHVLYTVLVVFGIAAVIFLLISLTVARSVRIPLTNIIYVTGAVAKGELNTHIKMERKDEFGLLSRHFNSMAEGLEEREFLRETFGKYVSENVARTLLNNRNPPKLGGEERIVTVLFSDLCGYSTISEGLPPVQVIEMLNQYLGAMNILIDNHHGCLIEIAGDAILAVFGAPFYIIDHSEQAVLCALEMRNRLTELNKVWLDIGIARYWKERGFDYLRARIGIHSGCVVAGNLGSPTRMKYSVIGDTVNVAARLETMNKTLGTDILVSSEVYAYLPENITCRMEEKGEKQIKGRNQPVLVYALK